MIFARRLHREQDLPDIGGGPEEASWVAVTSLLLTSSRLIRRPQLDAGLTTRAGIALRVLTNDVDDFAVDRDLLLSP